MSLRTALARHLMPHGLVAFLQTLPAGARLLDVGCGNDSPFRVKRVRPDLHYTGLDIGDYNQTRPNLADRYRLTTPERFAAEIAAMPGAFDAVVSSHNLEHCDDRDATLDAMIAALAPGGRLYLAFPCEASVRFPARRGTLNYFDDATHRGAPPDWDRTLGTIERGGLRLLRASARARPPVMWAAGLALEPASALSGRLMPGTWQFWGFESVVWAERA